GGALTHPPMTRHPRRARGGPASRRTTLQAQDQTAARGRQGSAHRFRLGPRLRRTPPTKLRPARQRHNALRAQHTRVRHEEEVNMAASRTGTAKWLRIRREAIKQALDNNVFNCPTCGVGLDYEHSRQPNSAEV